MRTSLGIFGVPFTRLVMRMLPGAFDSAAFEGFGAPWAAGVAAGAPSRTALRSRAVAAGWLASGPVVLVRAIARFVGVFVSGYVCLWSFLI